MIKYALVGQPNSGKTTLFNRLTGENRKTGNFAGVTVERVEGEICLPNGTKALLTDLPGSYTFSPTTKEEEVTREYLESGTADGFVFVFDAALLSRAMPFIAALSGMGKPLFLVANMADELKKDGRKMDAAALSAAFDTPVYVLSAAKGEGVAALCAGLAALPHPPRNLSALDASRLAGLAGAALRETEKKKRPLADSLDRLFLFPLTGIFFLLLFMGCIFFLTYGFPGGVFSRLFSEFIEGPVRFALSSLLIRLKVSPPVVSLVLEGILRGVGSVLAFAPQIAVLFFFLTALEDSGYMARAAALVNRPLTALGLGGKAFVPLLIGFGCSVPAMLSARTADSEGEREAARIAVPFIPCQARMAVYGLLAGILFPDGQFAVLVFLYLIGICAALLNGFFYTRIKKEKKTPFAMELPRYRLPSLRTIYRTALARTGAFVKKAGGVIFLSSVAVWVAQYFDFTFTHVPPEKSIAGIIGGFFAPLFAPLGFGRGEAVSALLVGLSAKEAVGSALSVFCPAGIETLFSPAAGLSFLVFTALYTPCIATLAAYRRETGSRGKTAFLLLWQTGFAWLFAFAVYRGALLFLA